MSITIRKGNHSDAAWISKLLVSGAQDRHFGPTVEVQTPGLVNALLNDGFMTIVKLRGTVSAPCKVNTELWVAEVNGRPASFLIALVDNNALEIELHLASTLKDFRRKGCFLALVAHAKSSNSMGYKIFARCYKKSSWAVAALQKIGFHKSKEGDPIELSL